MPTVRLLQAPADRSFPVETLQQRLGSDFKVEVAEDSGSRDRDCWHVLILNNDSVQSVSLQQQVAPLYKRHPERIIPVVMDDCQPEVLNPKLGFADFLDLRRNDPASWARLTELLQTKPGVGKLRPLQQIILFLSLKGGVAKTTNAVAIAEALANEGRDVLVIDSDHQCAASTLLLGEEALVALEQARTPRNLLGLFLDMLQDSFTPEQVGPYIQRAGTSIARINDHLSVLPCSLYIEEFALRDEVRTGPGTVTDSINFFHQYRVGGVVEWLKRRYDYVLIDCPPSLAWQVVVMLFAADAYLMPCIPDRLSIRGAKYLVDRLARLKARLNPLGLLWSLVNSRNPSHDRTIQFAVERDRDLYRNLPLPFRTYIPVTAQIRESQEVIEDASERPTTFKKKYKSLADDYEEVTKELVHRANSLGRGAVRPAASLV